MSTGQNRPAKVNSFFSPSAHKIENIKTRIQPATLPCITASVSRLDNNRRASASTTLPVCCYNTVPKNQGTRDWLPASPDAHTALRMNNAPF